MTKARNLAGMGKAIEYYNYSNAVLGIPVGGTSYRYGAYTAGNILTGDSLNQAGYSRMDWTPNGDGTNWRMLADYSWSSPTNEVIVVLPNYNYLSGPLRIEIANVVVGVDVGAVANPLSLNYGYESSPGSYGWASFNYQGYGAFSNSRNLITGDTSTGPVQSMPICGQLSAAANVVHNTYYASIYSSNPNDYYGTLFCESTTYPFGSATPETDIVSAIINYGGENVIRLTLNESASLMDSGRITVYTLHTEGY